MSLEKSILEQAREIFEHFAHTDPNPRIELNYSNAFTCAIAVLLSARATDKSVNKATEELFLKADNPQSIIELGAEKLKSYLKTIGLVNSKVKNILATCQIILYRYQGELPLKMEDLISLPGIGIKTASVILNVLCDYPIVAVDTHVLRVVNRLGIIEEKSADIAAVKLNKIIPKEFLSRANRWLVLHGRYICKSRSPMCHICPIINRCEQRFANKSTSLKRLTSG